MSVSRRNVFARIFDLSYLAAAVNGRVLANTVDLVAGGGVDDVVRLGSVARHVCGCGIWWVVWLAVELFGCRKRVRVWFKEKRALETSGFYVWRGTYDVGLWEGLLMVTS